MKPGKYIIKDLFASREIEQIVIPEIQRDYVWGESNVTGLINSLDENYKKYQGANKDYKIEVTKGDKSVSSLFDTFYKKQKYSTNIGFIYAYNDPEFAGKYFLIDGQQRITTIYLLLLALSKQSRSSEDFRNRYFKDNILKLDFKVREASHDFFQNFVHYILHEDLDITKIVEAVKTQYWYFVDYNNDKTIQQILFNYTLISDQIQKMNWGKEMYSYIEELVEFWYFDTNLSEQGEELYIYMNSRGEQVQENENLKAKLLSGLKENEKDKWGKEWEEWQDFFWKHKQEENENADKGFNEFLRWVQIIKMIENNEATKSIEDFINEKSKINSMYFSVNEIEGYINTIKFIFDDLAESDLEIQTNYSQYGDVLSIKEILSENWLSGVRNKFHYVILIPTLLYATKCKNKLSLYRFIRFFYNISKFKNVTKNPDAATVYALNITKELMVQNNYNDFANIISNPKASSIILTEEEKIKLTLYGKPQPDFKREEIEQAFWELEDHTLNDGEILHLYNAAIINNNFSFIEFTELSQKFFELFPQDDPYKNKIILQNLLLYFGNYWDKVSPNYYDNLDCGNWYSIIRKEVFFQFLNNFRESGIEIDAFYQKIKRCFLNKYTFEKLGNLADLREHLIVYSILLETANKSIWEKGKYIAVDFNKGEQENRLFKNELVYYNTKGDFRGEFGHMELWGEISNAEKSIANLYTEAQMKSQHITSAHL